MTGWGSDKTAYEMETQEVEGCGGTTGAWVCGSYVSGEVFLCPDCREPSSLTGSEVKYGQS